MYGSIFSLAFQGVRRKKKSSILIFMVLLLSFSFAITSLSLLGSMSKTNTEFQLSTYGEWYFGMPSGKEQDAEWLESKSWAERVGMSKNYGVVSDRGAGVTGFGTVDDMLKEVGHLKIEEGEWPAHANEIAMEGDVLGKLGLDYTLGQTITLQIEVSGKIVEQNFKLCGIIREYTDLWLLNMNRDMRFLNGAIVTEEAANQILEEVTGAEPVPQYFIITAEENRKTGMDELKEYMTNPKSGVDPWPCENSVAYPGSRTSKTNDAVTNSSPAEDNFYIYAIAAVALLAVICIYVMQLPAEIHSFAILRSIGITKGQMARLLITESLLLCVPAMIFGVPLGMALTWISLRMTVYAGSVPVQLAVPFETLGRVILLWIVMILLSRLIVYAVTVRTPLTGQFQMQRSKSRRAKILRSAFIVLLFGVFGVVTIFTSVEALHPQKDIERWLSRSSYHIWVRYRDNITNNNPCVLVPQVEQIEQVPGIKNAVGYSAVNIAIAFDGTEIGRTSYWGNKILLNMYAIESADWEKIFDFGADREPFDRGELVLLCFPDKKSPIDEAKQDFLIPNGDIQVLSYYGRLYEDFGKGDPVTPKPPLRFASEPTAVSVQYISHDVPYPELWRPIMLEAPYTVICSNAYIEKLTTLLPQRKPGESNFEPQWEEFSIDREVGYMYADAFVERSASGDMSTDKILAQLCSRNNFGLENLREINHAHIQESLQKLILLCSSGICIAFMALLICFGALSLETEQEKRYFRTMRIIGMSSKQMMTKVIGKALYRSGIAVASGWMFYFGYLMIKKMKIRTDMLYLVIVTLVCLVIPLILSLLAKFKLRKESWIS